MCNEKPSEPPNVRSRWWPDFVLGWASVVGSREPLEVIDQSCWPPGTCSSDPWLLCLYFPFCFLQGSWLGTSSPWVPLAHVPHVCIFHQRLHLCKLILGSSVHRVRAYWPLWCQVGVGLRGHRSSSWLPSSGLWWIQRLYILPHDVRSIILIFQFRPFFFFSIRNQTDLYLEYLLHFLFHQVVFCIGWSDFPQI